MTDTSSLREVLLTVYLLLHNVTLSLQENIQVI